jgi:hypothetical protein
VPKLIDYAVRFDFLRQGAFDVVLRRGVGALSRRALATALGTSVNTVRRLLAADVDLLTLAADEVDRRRRHGRMGRLRDAEPSDAAVHQLRKCLPDTEARIAEELVWLRLVLSTAEAPEDRDRDGLLLRERFRIFERGFVDEEDREQPDGPARARANPIVHHLAQREAAVSARVGEALDLLGGSEEDRPEREQEMRTLLAGLALEVCLGNLTPDAAVAVLGRTARRWCRARVAE